MYQNTSRYGGFHLKSSFRRKSTSSGTRWLTPKLKYVKYAFVLKKMQHRVITRKSHFLSSCDFQAIVQRVWCGASRGNIPDCPGCNTTKKSAMNHLPLTYRHLRLTNPSPSISPFLYQGKHWHYCHAALSQTVCMPPMSPSNCRLLVVLLQQMVGRGSALPSTIYQLLPQPSLHLVLLPAIHQSSAWHSLWALLVGPSRIRWSPLVPEIEAGKLLSNFFRILNVSPKCWINKWLNTQYLLLFFCYVEVKFPSDCYFVVPHRVVEVHHHVLPRVVLCSSCVRHVLKFCIVRPLLAQQ